MDRTHFNSDDQPAPKEPRADLLASASFRAEHRVILIADAGGFSVIPQSEVQTHAVRLRVARIGRSGTLFRLTWADQRLLRASDDCRPQQCGSTAGARGHQEPEGQSTSTGPSLRYAHSLLLRWLLHPIEAMRHLLRLFARRAS